MYKAFLVTSVPNSFLKEYCDFFIPIIKIRNASVSQNEYNLT